MPAAAGNHPGHQPGTTQARHLTGQGQLPCAHKGPNFVSVKLVIVADHKDPLALCPLLVGFGWRADQPDGALCTQRMGPEI